MPHKDKQAIILSFLFAVCVRDFGMKKDQSGRARVSICLRLFQREQYRLRYPSPYNVPVHIEFKWFATPVYQY